ncbi:LLM class flavin-dependent oxidoreductase [Saccharopolyspora sp. NPDC000995]
MQQHDPHDGVALLLQHLRRDLPPRRRHGYDTVFATDHLGIASPFPALVAAAQATERLKVGTLVLNAPFWNPALLAREIATTDVLTGGRLEVGLGAGHMKWEFDEAGIEWESFGRRAERLKSTIDELSRLFATDGYDQQTAMPASGNIGTAVNAKPVIMILTSGASVGAENDHGPGASVLTRFS